MFQYAVVFTLLVASGLAAPAPEPKPLVVAAPYVAAPAAVVTATSSQVIARNYNTLAAPYVAAPAVAYTAPLKAAPVVAAAYTSPYVAAAYTSPYVAAAYTSPYVAAPAVASAYYI